MRRVFLVLISFVIWGSSYAQSSDSCELNKDSISYILSDTIAVDSLGIDSVDVSMSFSVDSMLDSVISFAKNYIGCKYRYATRGPNTFDCSGYLNFIYFHFGYDFPQASSHYANLGKRVKLKDVRKGDVLVFKGRNSSSSRIGHVALVIESDIENKKLLFIHAASRGVIIDNYYDMDYYLRRLIMIRRPEY